MRTELPALLAFAGGAVSLSSASAAGVVAGLALVAVAEVLIVAIASPQFAALLDATTERA